MKILVVEDDNISALVLRKALEKFGHEVVVETNGLAALGVLESGKFALLISDWMMPKMDGVEMCRRIRQRSDLSQTYVIMLTARGLPEDRVAGLEAGADDFLVKPLDAADLVARLEVAKRILAMREQIKSSTLQLNQIRHDFDVKTSQLGEILIAQGTISSETLRLALELQGSLGQPLGRILVDNGWAEEEDLTRALSSQMDVSYVSIKSETPDPFVLALVPFEVAKKSKILPLSIGPDDQHGVRRMRLAMSNPWDIEAIDLVQRLTRYRVEPCVATESSLMTAIERAYNSVNEIVSTAEMTDSLQQTGVNIEVLDDAPDEVSSAELLRQSDQAPVIRFVNTMLADAVRRRASDIHIEPFRNYFQIRYRVDGVLAVIQTAPRQFLPATISRIKIMAEMDISERRMPLDGRITLMVDGRSVDLRISSLPNKFGERIVIRILNRASASVSLRDLGFSQSNLEIFESLIARPYGIILVTGPTGSGKTTTLYAALNALKSSKTNIMTCEDPIEYELEGVNQHPVNEKIGLTFARQLRAILRQDPDIILVGEIRDSETAEVAVRAALTGHLVLSTMHCNDAASASSRLIDMGIPSYLVAETLVGVVSQRLVRKLCPHCSRTKPATTEEITQLKQYGLTIHSGATFKEPVGCAECDTIGLKGRSAVHEILCATPDVLELIKERNDTASIRTAALANGMKTMLRDGLDKATGGTVLLEDVLRHVGAADLLPESEDLKLFPQIA